MTKISDLHRAVLHRAYREVDTYLYPRRCARLQRDQVSLNFASSNQIHRRLRDVERLRDAA
jgi:hypothetical protein